MAFNYYQLYQQQQQNNTINWVQGESGAKAYLMAPGGSTILMDSERPVFYIKSVDQSGMPSLRKFKFEEMTEAAPINTNEFVTKEELEKRLSEILPKAETKKSKKGEDE